MQTPRTLGELLQFYPFEDAALISTLPADHWFNLHFSLLTRAPYRRELYMEIPPVGLLAGVDAVDGNAAGPSGAAINQNDAQSVEMMEEGEHEGSTAGPIFDDTTRNRTHDVNSVTAVNRQRGPSGFQLDLPEDPETLLRTRYNEPNGPVVGSDMSVYHGNDNAMTVQPPNTPVNDDAVHHAAAIAIFVAAEAELQALNNEDREDDEENMPDNDANHIMNHGTIFEGIYVPTTANDRRNLIEYFRNEVMGDEVHDMAERYRMVHIAVDANDLDILELQEAMHVDSHRRLMLHAHVNDIRRHDWDRSGNCIYTLRVEGRAFRGDALSLQSQLLGVRVALWNYWAHRPTVNVANIHHYVNHFGIFGFYQAIMWHHLHENRWLTLWYRRRASRRG
ncbi:hypothetical protein QFC22_006345 [Naganishia vaughanmartiniae]|uniref:Uncharacterized protein n=1 Tax=Naganishia vaughanmartiniae TaxID=1424756 RepID=A0ACC2WME7_9TREE|nr:hypothetical protein QFC22_006345 [Naganishia vaughanmartiniae]